MNRSSENLFSQAARAVTSLTKYAAHDIYQTIGDVTQHLVDCKKLRKTEPLVTGIPFVIVWRCVGLRIEQASQNCSQSELSWFHKYLLPRQRLLKNLRELLTSDLTSQRIDLAPPKVLHETSDESFKIKFFGRGGVCLNFRVGESRQGLERQARDRNIAIAITVVFPSGSFSVAIDFLDSYSGQFLTTLNKEFDLSHVASLSGTPRISSPVEHLQLPETQSSFSFLQDILETVLKRVNVRLSATTLKIPDKFRATFLFRTGQRRNRYDEQYKYVFTRSQIADLKKTRLSKVSGGKLLASFMKLPGIGKLALKKRAMIEQWLMFQDKNRNLYDLLSNGQWFGEKSFVAYVSSLSPNQSMYISDWRIWYSSKALFRSTQEKLLFDEWLEERDPEFESDPRTEPLDRLLRSEIEKYHFGLQSMFMIPIYGASNVTPAAVVQISGLELSPEERIHDLQVVGFIYNEILGYMRADLLQEQLGERAQYDQFVDLAHLFTHAGTKLISTPMHNTLTRFENAIRDGRFKQADKIDSWSIADGLFTTKTLETTLGVLTRFDWMDTAKREGLNRTRAKTNSVLDANRRVMARGVDWNKVKQELTGFLETAFFRHFWNVCHDPRYREFETYFRQDEISVADMVRLEFDFWPPASPCLGHTDLMVMHLSNLMENAVEAFNLAKSALNWKKNEEPLWHVKFTSEQNKEVENRHKPGWVVLSLSNNSRPTRKEKGLLKELDEIFRQISNRNTDAFLRDYRTKMRHRHFTSKSGGSHGWALLEFASYLRRLEIREGTEIVRNGEISIRLKGPDEVVFDIRLPMIINSSEHEHYLEYSEDVFE